MYRTTHLLVTMVIGVKVRERDSDLFKSQEKSA